MFKTIFFLTVLFFSGSFVFGQTAWFEDMKKIQLFSVTRNDIHLLFGNPEEENFSLEYFETKQGRVMVRYATECLRKVDENGKEDIYGWKVPKFTVVRISLDLRKPLTPKKLKINLEKLTSYKSSDTPITIYEDEETGIEYYVFNNKITDISFGASRKQIEKFGCSK